VEEDSVSVWYCIPAKRKMELSSIGLWRARGYKIAVFMDDGDERLQADIVLQGAYPGYAQAVNALCAEVMKRDSSADWLVTGGDDVEPELSRDPVSIAFECSAYFQGTFGVMQPTGDRWADGSIDRIAGSPWMGRDWCLRANKGQGPLWPEFTHMFEDECLKRTAELLNVYWMRRDLTQLHWHFMRTSRDTNAPAVYRPTPEHLKQWTTQKHWDESKAIFLRLENQNFAPCMPVDIATTIMVESTA
jgi:hypothetical protein